MASRSPVPNLDEFLGSRAAQIPSGLSIRSHLDGPPNPEVVETLSRPHRTSFYFLLFVIRGTVRYSVDLKDWDVAEGELLFVKPWQVRTPPLSKNSAEFYKFTFGPEILSRLSGRHQFWMDPFGSPKVRFSPETQGRLKSTLESVRDAMLRGSPPEVVWAYLNALCSEIEASYFSHGVPGAKAAGLKDFLGLQELVEECYTSLPSVSHLARSLGLGSTQLYQLTKRWTGLSPKEYINRRIILEAYRFLLYEGLPVKELASRLGFADENYFSRFFRRQTGNSVSEFLALHQNSSRK
ncbi:MAG TPA: helix-turn-helix transcriptional regulator [Spirochaetia bacterium]|nr:helix-turn-helix transcriptional regulator [Spirochaetia bacterium]